MDKIILLREILKDRFNITNEDFSDDELIMVCKIYELENCSAIDQNSFNNFDMLESLYRVSIKNIDHEKLTNKIYMLYENELNKKLLELSDDGSICYSLTPEYSLILADMCANKIETSLCKMNFNCEATIPTHDLELYQRIRNSFETTQMKMPDKTEYIYGKALAVENDNFNKTIDILNNQHEYHTTMSKKIILDIELRKLIKNLYDSKVLDEVDKNTLNRMITFLKEPVNTPKNYTVKLSEANRSLALFQQMYETATEIKNDKQKVLKK